MLNVAGIALAAALALVSADARSQGHSGPAAGGRNVGDAASGGARVDGLRTVVVEHRRRLEGEGGGAQSGARGAGRVD